MKKFLLFIVVADIIVLGYFFGFRRFCNRSGVTDNIITCTVEQTL